MPLQLASPAEQLRGGALSKPILLCPATRNESLGLVQSLLACLSCHARNRAKSIVPTMKEKVAGMRARKRTSPRLAWTEGKTSRAPKLPEANKASVPDPGRAERLGHCLGSFSLGDSAFQRLNQPVGPTSSSSLSGTDGGSNPSRTQAYSRPAQRPGTLSSVQRARGGGSHGKHLHFSVTAIQITDTGTGQKRYVNARHDEDLGPVPTHGMGSSKQKTQADADAVAAGAVTLGSNERITDITWRHYTK